MSETAPAEVTERMRDDWNQRAREDAHYYVAFGGRNQDEEAFLATAAEVVHAVEWELKRLQPTANIRTRRALEIGCGPGRLMKPLSQHFGEIHGVDVSDEMIRIARERLRGIPHAHVHATNGASLAQFANQSFDVVYSYAVFQHIPSRDVVYEYMREIERVLKPGGVFRGQFNGLPPSELPNTWGGVSFSTQDIRRFTLENGLALLALEGVHTQYMWTTWRKPGGTREPGCGAGSPAIARITNASGSEAVVPQRGSMAALSAWVTNLPPECDLNSLDVRLDGLSGDLVYLGAQEGGLRQLNVMLPQGTRTGLVPVELLHAGALLCPAAFLRVIPAGPLVPRILKITDGINLIHENRSISGSMKVYMEEVANPELLTVEIDGQPVTGLDLFCTDPMPPRHEINFHLPASLCTGTHDLQIRIGRRALMPRQVEVG